jgi:hypothetical protein
MRCSLLLLLRCLEVPQRRIGRRGSVRVKGWGMLGLATVGTRKAIK